MSSETVKLYDKNDALVDELILPANYMEGQPERWVIVEGKKFVEGGGVDSFYGKGQFAEVD